MYLHIHIPYYNPPDLSLHFLAKNFTFEYDRKHVAKPLPFFVLQCFTRL